MKFLLKSKKAVILTVLIVSSLLIGGLVTGCGEEQVDEIELAKVEWTCSTQKGYVNKAVLETLGYDVNLNNYSLPVILEGMTDGQIDAFADVWFQTWGQALEESLEAGEVIHLETHIEGANYKPAVPTYVYEAGVTSLEDLAEHSEEFDYTYHGLEPGNEGNQIMIDAFEEDTYGLGEWDIVESNEAAMMADVEQNIEEEEWVVFPGWEPHYMNVIFDMEYLDDPKNIWGEGEEIGTIVRPDLEDDIPQLAQYLEQFDPDIDTVDDWVYEYGYEERAPEEVADEWISINLDEVKEWVDGLETLDGQDAQEALEEAYQ